MKISITNKKRVKLVHQVILIILHVQTGSQIVMGLEIGTGVKSMIIQKAKEWENGTEARSMNDLEIAQEDPGKILFYYCILPPFFCNCDFISSVVLVLDRQNGDEGETRRSVTVAPILVNPMRYAKVLGGVVGAGARIVATTVEETGIGLQLLTSNSIFSFFHFERKIF